ncbi:MAG: PDZ domain-containing protein, partial [Armatimonadota bacterium]
MPLFTEFTHSSQASIDLEHRPQLAGVVAQVIDGSPAELAGIVPGDQILVVNGHPVEDVIDVQFYGAEEDCTITICRGTQEYQIWVPKNVDQQLGIAFEDDLFDGVRICRNRCDFCFVDQQPNGMRDTLKIRDDDFRLSFLHGNFITLTNLTDYDWRRVFQQKLSPLFVSVHATDDALRKRLLRNNRLRSAS